MTRAWDRAIVIVTVLLVLAVFVAIAACGPEEPATPAPTADPHQQREDNGMYYRSCGDAPGPLYAGDPGYRPALDRDGDGVACDG